MYYNTPEPFQVVLGGAELMLEARLNQVLEIKEMTRATVVGGKGRIFEGLPDGVIDPGSVHILISNRSASNFPFVGRFGEGESIWAMIEDGDNPVLPILIEIEVDDFVVEMNSASRLGRTSFHLPKPLPKIGKAVTA
ncbi:MAG: hypothetical protein OXM87_12925 [Truepera sp.]|nr:hypothetical protein [Truepera sp.]